MDTAYVTRNLGSVGASAPRPDRTQTRLPLASWSAFEAGVRRLGPTLPSDGAVDIAAMGLKPSTEKQVVASLRALGLLSAGNVADFRLRRLVARGDFSTVVEALAEHFPDLVRAIQEDAGPEQLAAAVRGIDAPTSSKKRFASFVRGAMRAIDQRVPRFPVSPPSQTPRQGRHRRGAGDEDDPTARRLLEAEADGYVAALERALSRDDLEAATVLSDRLRSLRAEMRAPLA